MRIINGPPVGRLERFPYRLHCRHPGCDALFELESPADLLISETDASQGGVVIQRPPRLNEVVIILCPVCKLPVAQTKYLIPDGGLRLMK